MKILIFENEIQEVVDAFKDVNFVDFNNELVFKWIVRSQDFKDSDLKGVDLIFVDIDLSLRSDKDGYGVIENLINNKNFDKLVIMTGHEVKNRPVNLAGDPIKLIHKPIILEELREVIDGFKKAEHS